MKTVQFSKMEVSGDTSRMNSRFVQYFNLCATDNNSFKLNHHLKLMPIYWTFLKQEFGLISKVLAGLIVVFFVIIPYTPIISWTISAFGRLLLINVASYWNWRELYNQKCLWDVPVESSRQVDSSYYPLDCSICEHFGINSIICI